MVIEEPHRSYLTSVLGCYCPRCRQGKLFTNPIALILKRNLQMPERCPVCGQPTDIEVGFYYGTGYVSYLITFFFSIISFLLWWLLIGLSFSDNRFLYWVIFNALFLIALQPWLMRFSRSLWLSFFVRYDPYWAGSKPDDPKRQNTSQKNNW